MVNSPGFIEHVLQHGARWVELVPNGAEPEMFEPNGNGSQYREDNQLGDQFIVLYAGAHGMSNDLGIVLQAAARLRDRPGYPLCWWEMAKRKPGCSLRQKNAG
jgi:hypothetical protein